MLGRKEGEYEFIRCIYIYILDAQMMSIYIYVHFLLVKEDRGSKNSRHIICTISSGSGSLKRMETRWFKVPFSSPSWRTLNPLKGSLNHPKKVTLNHQGFVDFFPHPTVLSTSRFRFFWQKCQDQMIKSKSSQRMMKKLLFPFMVGWTYSLW